MCLTHQPCLYTFFCPCCYSRYLFGPSTRQDDEAILFAQAEAAVAAALAVLGNGGALPAATAAAEAAAADAEAAAVAAAAAAAGGGSSSGVDEFGRDLGLQRRQELQKGAGRRAALVAGVSAQVASLQQGE